MRNKQNNALWDGIFNESGHVNKQKTSRQNLTMCELWIRAS